MVGHDVAHRPCQCQKIENACLVMYSTVQRGMDCLDFMDQLTRQPLCRLGSLFSSPDAVAVPHRGGERRERVDELA